ncbi:MAG: hypothetical protein J3Q66DRAFT_408827 [Benniella sp.]|nr:MAG: hypothetical protein J3Q66DRAFT_408827 [Benniella sp.]
MSKITPQRSSARSIGTKKPSFSALLVLVAMLFSVMVPIVSARNTLMSNEQLLNGEYLESPDGSKRFVIQDGKAIIEEKGIRDLQTWLLTPENDQGSDPKQYRFGLDVYGMLNGLDGSLQVTRSLRRTYEKQEEGAWELSLWNNGILYLKNPNGVIVWNNICDSFAASLESNNMLIGECLASPDYGSLLYMKENGNLVLYNGYTTVSSISRLYPSDDQHPVYLYLTSTGTLKLLRYNSNDECIVYNNDISTVKEDKYRLTITNEARIMITDSSSNQVGFIPHQKYPCHSR